MLRKILNRWKKKEDGTTAIEFALLAFPFMLTTICILELSIYFATGVLLEGAVQDSARLVRTGQLQQSTGDPLQEFLDELCDRAWPLMNCDNFEYQLDRLDSFAAASAPVVDTDGRMQPPDQFDIAEVTAGCIALVRVTYPYQFLTPFFGTAWSNYPGNTRLLMSTIVFRVEPFDLVVTDPSCTV